MVSLAQDQLRMRNLQVAPERSTGSLLYAMVGPQNLSAVAGLDCLKFFFS